MSDPKQNNPDPSDDHDPVEPLTQMDIDQWLERLRRSDRSLYNTMALEVWSIAKTMDGLIPSFWNRFMINRRLSLQQFMEQKHARRSTADGYASASEPHDDNPENKAPENKAPEDEP